MENNLPGNNMVFGKTSLMYEQVPQGDPDDVSIDEELLKSTLDKQAGPNAFISNWIIFSAI